jgi:hypothetical protein
MDGFRSAGLDRLLAHQMSQAALAAIRLLVTRRGRAGRGCKSAKRAGSGPVCGRAPGRRLSRVGARRGEWRVGSRANGLGALLGRLDGPARHERRVVAVVAAWRGGCAESEFLAFAMALSRTGWIKRALRYGSPATVDVCRVVGILEGLLGRRIDVGRVELKVSVAGHSADRLTILSASSISSKPIGRTWPDMSQQISGAYMSRWSPCRVQPRAGVVVAGVGSQPLTKSREGSPAAATLWRKTSRRVSREYWLASSVRPRSVSQSSAASVWDACKVFWGVVEVRRRVKVPFPLVRDLFMSVWHGRPPRPTVRQESSRLVTHQSPLPRPSRPDLASRFTAWPAAAEANEGIVVGMLS